jgi:hypothetical protein
MGWKIVKQDEPGMLILSVIQCQTAWSMMTHRQRLAVKQATSSGWLGPDIHHSTLAALVRHGIANEDGYLTPAGRDVLKYAPKKAGAS